MLKKDNDFYDEIELLFVPKEKKGVSVVRSITFQVTDACNLRCSYCYQINKQEHKMDFNTAKKFIDYMFREYENPNNPYLYKDKAFAICVDFIGGEPLLEAKLIYEIIEYFEYQFYLHPNCTWGLFHRFNIGTNGTLYFLPDAQKILADYGNFVSVAITLDGIKEYHDSCRLFPDGSGSYDLALKAIQAEQKRSGLSVTKITISPDNIKYIFKAIKNVYDLGIHFIYINCCFEDIWGNTEKERLQIAQQLYYQEKKVADWIIDNNIEDIYVSFLDKEYQAFEDCNNCEKISVGCGSGNNMLAIDYKGDIFPCIRFMDSSLNGSQPEYIIGNVEYGLGHKIEERQRLYELKHFDNIIIEDKCKSCNFKTTCRSCPGYNYQIFGIPYKRTTFYCYTEIVCAIVNYYFNKKTNNYNGSFPENDFIYKILPDKEIKLLKEI